MSLKVLKPGMQTTVQDLGRNGYQRQGVPMGGAMDKLALRIANLLVGNPENFAAIECCLQGPSLLFEHDTLICLGGANLSASIGGQPLRRWRPVLVKAGQELHFGKPMQGVYAYVAIGGGVAVPESLGSRSTYLRASLGGHCGRALNSGDILHQGSLTETGRSLLSELLLHGEACSAFVEALWQPEPELLPQYAQEPQLRAQQGLEYHLFSENSQEYIWSQKFKVSAQSDRMGYRLQGTVLALAEKKEMLSVAVVPGTVQVPPSGQPIVLMADSQTTGGYPRIAQVISTDLPLLAQMQPGQVVHLQEVSLEEAQQALYRCEKQLLALQQAIYYKINHT